MTTQSTSPAGPRPKRFPLELPLEVRVAGSADWWNATTEDVSANGMRFRAGAYIPPQTPVDVKLQLPPALTGDGTVRLECSGYVVRSNKPSLVSDEARMAVTFLEFHLADTPNVGASGARQTKSEAIRRDLAT
ncbi:MAG: PilZ domain-containing protein, partial [Terriglobales bacterium]